MIAQIGRTEDKKDLGSHFKLPHKVPHYSVADTMTVVIIWYYKKNYIVLNLT